MTLLILDCLLSRTDMRLRKSKKHLNWEER